MEHHSEKKEEKKTKNAATVKMLIVGLLILVLMVPLTFVKFLITDRAERQESVISEINEKWGKEVLIYGPTLKIPYKTYKKSFLKDKEGNVTTKTELVIENGYFFPEELHTQGKVNPEKKHRGIYTTAVFKTSLNFKGSFSTPNFESLDIDKSDILWEQAKIILKTSNLKGINNQVAINVNNTNYSFIPEYDSDQRSLNNLKLHKLETKVLSSLNFSEKQKLNFSLTMDVNGSESIRIIPIGKETKMNISSNWMDKSFIGNYLPFDKGETTEGFNAKWQVLQINRPFAQEFFEILPKLEDFAFGVNFMIPVDDYLQSERATKYGYLVITLTFLVFFIIQSLSKINIHPFQYLMIGLALIMFYTLLISITEHSNFLKAYTIASISVISLITLYSKSILKTFKFPLFILISLGLLYSFIYVIIQLESYALLVGSIGLFAILSIVMYVSRKIEWN